MFQHADSGTADSGHADPGSVTFLDLLTCGLGGMLLLFFIVVAFKSEMDDTGEAMASMAARDPRNVVLLHLASRDGTSLLADQKGTCYLACEERRLKSHEAVELVVGSSFLTCYAKIDLPAGTRLMVTGLRADAPIEGFVADRFGTRAIRPAPGPEPCCLYHFGGEQP